MVYPDFLTIGYEKDGLTVAQDDTVTFTIDNVIPARIYHVEIIVDDKFIFPSRADESKFTVDKSSLGTETNIIEIVGVDAVVRKAVDLINKDPSLIIDEDKLVNDIISNTGIGNINEYYQAFNDLKPKAEQSISRSLEALSKSQNALNVANGIDAKATNALSLSESADTLSKSVQEQFNQVVIDGDSSVEAAQARVDASGHTNPTLKARLDKEHNEVTTQLAHIIQQTHGKNVKVVSGVIRNTTDEWKPIVDANHQGDMGVSSITTGDVGIDINFNFVAKKVISFVAVPDEAYANELLHMGSSVVPDKATINLYKGKVDSNRVAGRVYYANGDWVVQDNQGITGASFGGSNDLNIDHEPCESFIINITSRKPVIAVFASATSTRTQVAFFDWNGEKITTPSDLMSITFERTKLKHTNQLQSLVTERLNPKQVNNPYGNIWFTGIFEV